MQIIVKYNVTFKSSLSFIECIELYGSVYSLITEASMINIFFGLVLHPSHSYDI